MQFSDGSLFRSSRVCRAAGEPQVKPARATLETEFVPRLPPADALASTAAGLEKAKRFTAVTPVADTGISREITRENRGFFWL